MKSSNWLKKLTLLILLLGLAGCWMVPPPAEAGSTKANEGQALKVKKKFSDSVYIHFNPRLPPYLTKRAHFNKNQARQFVLKNTSIHFSLVQKTISNFIQENSTGVADLKCENVIFKAQEINLENYLKQQGVPIKDLLALYLLTPEQAKAPATLMTVTNCPNFKWSKQFVILHPKSIVESRELWGTHFIFWKEGVLFRGSSGLRQ